MNEHVARWLEAYHDGELNSRRYQQAETHLSTCKTCRAELESIQVLSTLLAEAPKASTLISPEAFVTQVSLRLPRKPKQTNWQRVYRTSWRLAPIGILTTWAFLQAAIIVSGILNLGIRVFPGSDQLMGLLPPQDEFSILEMITSSNIIPLEIGRFGLDFLEAGSPLGWFPTLSMGLTILIGMLYLSWLASWWIQQTNGNSKQSI